ncbi:heavy-metal-associated domain-containing protein [Amphibiibacter pelophylacis]|uniref:Heavy-metal-associated domain-containing protein n=1 Tax=Amphibiibacter pelophylacis TaxID=1799477 RepID=A0ACC6P5L9_9BURK
MSAQPHTLLLSVPDMSCGHCEKSVTRALHELDAEADVQVDLAARTVRVETLCSLDQVQAALNEEGYTATRLP